MWSAKGEGTDRKRSRTAKLFRQLAILLGALLAMAGLSAGPASASTGQGAATYSISQAPNGDRGAAGVAATTCTVGLSAPVRAGAAEVAVDYSVRCDQEVLGIAGFIAIFRGNEAVPLGGTVDQFNFGLLGGGEQIKRPCAAGVLYGKMRVVVNFKTGEPKTIDRTFFGPAANIAC
ncbi:hypothetical protein [Amycolatopsis orientalis]|uniref:hypothetical protein n=1 Tax=Amycolatopsis orientalis TaxID=31958 RepID=UPI000401269B|nr:hypothetical protein [Amycolatopsis orientalis]